MLNWFNVPKLILSVLVEYINVCGGLKLNKTYISDTLASRLNSVLCTKIHPIGLILHIWDTIKLKSGEDVHIWKLYLNLDLLAPI